MLPRRGHICRGQRFRLSPALAGLALLLAAPGTLAAQTTELKSSIDQAGSAAGRQIEQWLGGTPPKPARKTRAKPVAPPSASAKSVPLPPPRPTDADSNAAEVVEEPAEAPAESAASSKPATRPAGLPLFGARPTTPPRPPAGPAGDEPGLAEAPGIPLPPVRPDRAGRPMPPAPASAAVEPPERPQVAAVPPAAAPAKLTTPGTGKPANVPLPPQRPQMAAQAQPDIEPDEVEEDVSAAHVPLPPPRPGSQAASRAQNQTAMLTPALASPAPTAPEAPLAPPTGPLAGCPELSIPDIGTFATAEVKMAPGCRIERPVNLTGIRLKDGRLVPLEPAATLRCDMAAAVARWVREGVAPAVETLGSPLAAIQVADSYACRPRNRVKGAKISEHGQGNAMDTRGYTLMDGRRVLVGGTGEQAMPVAFQEQLKASACADFMTILGPGSDGFHELHLHVDRAVRRNNMVLCRWAIGTPPPGTRAEAADAKTDASKTDAPKPDASKPDASKPGAPAAGPKAAAKKEGAKSTGDTTSSTAPEQVTPEPETDAPEDIAEPADDKAGTAGNGAPRSGGGTRK